MELLKPKKGEGHFAFLARFMKDPTMKSQFQDIRQRSIMARKTWEDCKRKKP